MFKILLPVGASEERGLKAAEYVTQLPRCSDEVEVVVLTVFKDSVISGEGGQVRSEDRESRDELIANVDSIVEYLQEQDIKAEKRQEQGEPEEEIVRISNEAAVDTIIMGGRKRSPIGKAVFGSVTQQVLLSATCPVTIITEDE